MDISNKVWIVTGAASGLGLAVVQALNSRTSASGVSIALLDLNEEAGEQVAAQQKDAKFWRCDVGDEENVKAALKGVREHWKGKHWGGVVHCGGVGMAGKVRAV